MMTCLSHCLARCASERPSADCWSDERGTLTFSQANEAVNEAARDIREVTGGGPLALIGKNSTALVVALIGALRARVPCFWISADMASVEVERLLELGGASGVCRSDSLQARRASATGARELWRTAGADYGFVSSGSTGEPRLALRSAASLVEEGKRYQELLELSASDRVLAALPLAHAYAFGAALAAGLVCASAVVLQPATSVRAIAHQVRSGGITFLPLVRPLARALAELDAQAPERGHHLRVAMVGAGPLSSSLAHEFAAKWGCSLSRNYGSSETGAVLAALAGEPCAGAGRPMPGVKVDLVPLEPNVVPLSSAPGPGQLWIHTSSPALGHLTRDGLQPPRTGPGGWWPTGDLCRRDEDGSYVVLGRLGKEIRRGGRSILPGEVVSALEAHPSVLEAAVAGRLDEDGEEHVVASVRLREGCEPSRAALAEHLSGLLAAYKHPTEWHFVEALPRTWSGKPIALPAGAPAPARDRSIRDALFSYRATEAVLAAHQVGLLDQLQQGGTTAELAQRLGLDAHALEVLMPVLAELGLAVCSEQTHSWCGPALNGSLSLVHLEEKLRGSWLRAEQIASVLRSGVADREFEREGPTAAFAEAYRVALAGSAQVAFAHRLVRKLRLARPRLRLLELGRSLGPLAQALELACTQLEIDVIAVHPGPPVQSDWLLRSEVHPIVARWEELELSRERYDLVHLSNAVHWLSPERAPAVWAQIARSMRAGGRLVITDTFQVAARPGASGSSSVAGVQRCMWRLDWLTHGGTWLLSAEEAQRELRKHFGRDSTLYRFEGNDLAAIELRCDGLQASEDHDHE